MIIITDYIKDIFEGMMTEIRSIYDPDNLEEPYFQYGSKYEITQQLSEKDRKPTWQDKKYPLVCLYVDTVENRGGDLVGYTVSPVIDIVVDSIRNYRSPQRIDDSVKNILHDIYKLILDEIADNPAFWANDPGLISHNLLYWNGNPTTGGETGLIFNDYLDGINITFNDLKIFANSPSCESVSV